MLSKFEAWILKLRCEVDATKPAWRFVSGLMRTNFEAWILKLGCKVDATKQAWRADAIEIGGIKTMQLSNIR
jgi:hypothetical protein